LQEAVTDPKWHKVMNEETMALEKNDTWTVEDLPLGKKHISCKCIESSTMPTKAFSGIRQDW